MDCHGVRCRCVLLLPTKRLTKDSHGAQDARTSCLYRIAQEGLPMLLPAMTKQLVFVTAQELLRLLTENSIALPQDMRLPMETLVRSCVH